MGAWAAEHTANHRRPTTRHPPITRPLIIQLCYSADSTTRRYPFGAKAHALRESVRAVLGAALSKKLLTRGAGCAACSCRHHCLNSSELVAVFAWQQRVRRSD